MHRIFFKIAATSAALAVIIGAIGTHILKSILEEAALESVKTASYYQLVHSIALFMVGMLYRHYDNKKILYAGYAFILGIILFSGSLYLMVGLNKMGSQLSHIIVYFTPFGGLFLVSGWLFIVVGIPPKKGYVKERES
jgi:uncharacterized membrane protein YgdD (TMEM256/DUF423 family)